MKRKLEKVRDTSDGFEHCGEYLGFDIESSEDNIQIVHFTKLPIPNYDTVFQFHISTQDIEHLKSNLNFLGY